MLENPKFVPMARPYAFFSVASEGVVRDGGGCAKVLRCLENISKINAFAFSISSIAS